jgi:signal transduction histidine kinase
VTATGHTSTISKERPRLGVWTGMACAAAALTVAIAGVQAGAGTGASLLLLGGSALALGLAGWSERRLRMHDDAALSGGPIVREDASAAVAPDAASQLTLELGALAGLAGSTVMLVSVQGRIEGAATPDGVFAPGGSLLDAANVAERPALLLALSAAGRAPQSVAILMHPSLWFEGGRAELRIIAAGALRLVSLRRAVAEAPGLQGMGARALAHDVRAPLAVIAGLADALAETGVATASMRDDYPALMARAARDAMALAEACLGSASEAAPEQSALGDVMRTVAERCADAAAATGSTIYVRCPRDLENASVERRLALQVLSNLVGNALKHGGDGVSVELAAAWNGGRVELLVSDNGCGMDVAAVRCRGEKSPTAGHGLGLDIVERLVAPGGRLTLDTAPGRGLRARVLLPHRAGGRDKAVPAVALLHDRTRTLPPEGRPIELSGGPDAPFKRIA